MNSTLRSHPGLRLVFLGLACLLDAAMVPASERLDDEVIEEAIEGRVTTRGGALPVEQAQVTVTDRPSVTRWTDATGRFSLPCARPCGLTVDHPRFVVRELVVDGESPLEPDGRILVELEPKREVYEQVEVTATRGLAALTPISVAATEVEPLELAALPSSLAETVQTVAGVAENGQPGLFQVVAVRGVSRQRVLTFLGGAPLFAERRAGVAASFVDPLLFDSVEVVRGPSSTYYGSGALGGVLRIVPRRFEDVWIAGGWESFADESHLVAGWGDGGWSVGVAHRRAERDEVADGTLQNTAFEQTSAVLAREWSLAGDDAGAGRVLRLTLTPSIGRDIGKPNSDFPDRRITVYPDEEHLVAELELVDDDGWSVRAFAHPNRLVTETLVTGTLRPAERFSVVENQAFDFGASGERAWRLGSGGTGDGRSGDGRSSVTLRAGADWFARRGVDAVEVETDLGDGSTTRTTSLESGSQDEVAVFGDARWSLGATSLAAGARLTWQRQSNDATSSSSRDDLAPSAFVGLVRPLGGGWEATVNVGTGLRFPGLSERFFSGTTARGEIVGNEDLDPERSLSADLGVRYYGLKTYLAAHAFRLEIDDFIERVERDDGALAFVNLTSGRILGVELEGFHQLRERWRLDWAGHWLDGETDDGAPLSDVSPDRLQAGLAYRGATWRGRIRWQHRFSKNDAGGGEIPIDSADVVSAAVGRRLAAPGFARELEIELRVDNLLDETYLASADDRSSPAPGRSIGVGFVWQPR